MTGLRLTVLLGPRETVETAELKMGALPHTLAMAVPFDSWNEAAGGNVLPVAMAKVAEMFAAGIKRGEHLAEPAEAAEDEAEPLLDNPASPPPIVHASAELFSIPGTLLGAILYELDREAYERVLGCMEQARRIVALVERRAA